MLREPGLPFRGLGVAWSAARAPASLLAPSPSGSPAPGAGVSPRHGVSRAVGFKAGGLRALATSPRGGVLCCLAPWSEPSISDRTPLRPSYPLHPCRAHSIGLLRGLTDSTCRVRRPEGGKSGARSGDPPGLGSQKTKNPFGTLTQARGGRLRPGRPSVRLRVPNSPLPSGVWRGVQ